MGFDTLPKHNSVNRKKKEKKNHAAALSVLIKGFENRFQDGKKNQFLVYLQLHFQLTEILYLKFSSGM